MNRLLIINADDLGYTPGVNGAVARCASAQGLRSATLMAGGASFPEAAMLARAHPQLGIGVHLTLTELPPVSPYGSIPDLTGESGNLPRTPSDLAYGLQTGRISRQSLRRELSAQIARVKDAGLNPTHLDSHKHVHVLPQVLDVVVELARHYNIRWIRSPFDHAPLRPFFSRIPSGLRSVFLKQRGKADLLKCFRPNFMSRLRRASLRTPDHFFGVSLTGLWNRDAMIGLLEGLPPGLNEWMVHPGDCDAALRQHPTRLLQQREQERDLLLDPVLHETLLRMGIRLISFGDLTA